MVTKILLFSVLRILKYLWAAPNTMVGLLLVPAAWLRGGRVRITSGVIEGHGPVIAWLLRHLIPLRNGAAAVTVGHVVLAKDGRTMDGCRRHERVHVRQFERWGPFFLPAYITASIIALCRGRHLYYDNVFEKEAYAKERNRRL
jgi:hypothetical protein